MYSMASNPTSERPHNTRAQPLTLPFTFLFFRNDDFGHCANLCVFPTFPTTCSCSSFSLFDSKKFSVVTTKGCFVVTFSFFVTRGLTSTKSKNKVLFVCFYSSRSFSTNVCFFLLAKRPMSAKCTSKKK